METPALRHLMAAYFHQDWELDGLDDRETVQAFVRDAPDLAVTLVAEMIDVLTLDEAGVQQRLNSLGCEIEPSPTSNDSYHAWLTELVSYAREATQ